MSFLRQTAHSVDARVRVRGLRDVVDDDVKVGGSGRDRRDPPRRWRGVCAATARRRLFWCRLGDERRCLFIRRRLLAGLRHGVRRIDDRGRARRADKAGHHVRRREQTSADPVPARRRRRRTRDGARKKKRSPREKKTETRFFPARKSKSATTTTSSTCKKKTKTKTKTKTRARSRRRIPPGRARGPFGRVLSVFPSLPLCQTCCLARDVRPERAPNAWIGARSRGARGARLGFAPTRFSRKRFTLRGASAKNPAV